MNISVPVLNTMEYINSTNISPLIDKVQIKVCYVGQDPNRNGSVITKEVATKFGENLPGCPIVGYYNEKEKDFEGHNREVSVDEGKFRIIDMTKPYGFVDTNAKVWFEKFLDDGVEHEYLCTEGYLWTKIYKESQRVIDKGNNQSMELSDEYTNGFWAKDENSNKDIFIISDGLIEKLCILGSNVEPCFEGAQINSFSLINEDFKEKLFSMAKELSQILDKGGSEQQMTEEKVETYSAEEVTLQEEEVPEEFAQVETPSEEVEFAAATTTVEETVEPASSEEEVIDYELKYQELSQQYEALAETVNQMSAELEQLRQFKLDADRKQKQEMINDFYMLSDEDKKDVIENIDKYSLDDIEAKLCIICVRNKVDFKANEEQEQQLTFNLQYNDNSNDEDDAPAWVKAVRQNA